jgi:hypothetical protein
VNVCVFFLIFYYNIIFISISYFIDHLYVLSFELDLGFFAATGDLPEDLVAVGAEGFAHVGDLLGADLDEHPRDLLEEVVGHVVVPGRAEDAVVRLDDEVVRDVVYYYHLGHVTPQQGQVLH